MGIFSGIGSSVKKDEAQRADNPTDGCRLIREGHKDVQLSFCTIGDEGARMISKELLADGCAVENLNLYQSDIGDAGASALAEALRSNTVLERIYLDANKITDVGAMALAEGLRANNTLTILGIEGNPIGDAGTRAIADALADKGVTIHTDDTFSKAKIATDVSALIAAAREQDAGQQEAFLAAKNAVSAAPDAAAREELRRALADMYVGFSGGGTRDAIVESVMRSFEKARLTSDGQLDRLKALMGKCTDKYRTLTDRWTYLMNIEWTAPPGPVTQTVPFWYEALRGAPPAAKPQDMREWCRQAVDLDAAFNPFPGCDADEAYIRYLFVEAQWVDFKHQAIMRQLVKRFNAATFPAELGLDEEAWPLSLVNDHAVGEKAQHRAGPVKSRTRSEDKVKNDYADRPAPAAASLIDLCRSTVVFDDPYALAAFLAFMRHLGLDIIRVKNKFSDLAEPGAENRYRDVLMNWRVAGHVCETQLALADLSQIKKEIHKYYEIQRAQFFTEVVQPMFKQPLDVDGEALLEAEIAANAKKPK